MKELCVGISTSDPFDCTSLFSVNFLPIQKRSKMFLQ
jgi:hypothetical protein